MTLKESFVEVFKNGYQLGGVATGAFLSCLFFGYSMSTFVGGTIIGYIMLSLLTYIFR